MSEAIRATQAYLTALNCLPEDKDYKEQFKERLAIEEAAAERRRVEALTMEERRRADEAEERRRADEAEERRRADEAEERRLYRAHELAMAQTKNAAPQAQVSHDAPPNAPTPRVVLDILPFAPTSERADRFIRRFETIVEREKVPEERYAEQLMKALPPAEAAPLLGLPIEDQFNYETLKEAFLRRHRVTEAQLREDFKNARPAKDDNAASFTRTLGRAFDYWVEAINMEKTYDDLRDRIIVDQVTDILPTHLLVLLRENHARTVEDLVIHLDAYFDARPSHSLHYACQSAAKHSGNQKQNNQSRQGPTQKPQMLHGATPPAMELRSNPPNTPKTRANAQTPPAAETLKPATAPAPRSRPSPGSPAGNSGRSGGTASPRGCHHHGPNSFHTSEQCFVLHPERRPRVPPAAGHSPDELPTALPTPPRSANVALSAEAPAFSPLVNEDTMPQDAPVQALTALTPAGGPQVKSKIKICSGIVNAKPVEVLLDTGCDTIFVAQRLVDPTDYTGHVKPVRTAMGLHPGCPVAKVTFGCPYFSEGPTLVVVLEDPPYDVLLGEVPGTLKFNEDPYPSPTPANKSNPVRPSTNGTAVANSCLQLSPQLVEGADYLPTTTSSATRSPPPSGATQVLPQNNLAPRGCSFHGPRASHISENCWERHSTRPPVELQSPRRDPDNWRQPATTSSPSFNLRPRSRVGRCGRKRRFKRQRNQQYPWLHCHYKGPDICHAPMSSVTVHQVPPVAR